MIKGQEVKRKFAESIYTWLVRTINENPKAKIAGEDMFTLAENSGSILARVPNGFFNTTQNEPTIIEIKFTVKK